MKQERFHSHGDFSPPSRRMCETCAQERIFQNYKCLTCGTFRKMIPQSKQRTWHVGQDRLRRLKLYKQASGDKAAYYKRMAEESRKKFEGGK